MARCPQLAESAGHHFYGRHCIPPYNDGKHAKPNHQNFWQPFGARVLFPQVRTEQQLGQWNGVYVGAGTPRSRDPETRVAGGEAAACVCSHWQTIVKPKTEKFGRRS